MNFGRVAPGSSLRCTPFITLNAFSGVLHTKQLLFFTGHSCPHSAHVVRFPGRLFSCSCATSVARGGSWLGASGKL